jgi:hypothetical protein
MELVDKIVDPLQTMKTAKTFSLVVALIILLSNCSKKDDILNVHSPLLIAHYPLLSDGSDVTNLNGDMTLINTPFQNGGIYCSGISYSLNNYCIAESSPIKYFKFQSFSISMDFFVSENKRQPVWIIGSSCRWLGFYLYDDGTVALMYNNGNFLTTTKTYSLNEWHNAQITFDGTTVKMFLDGGLAGSLKFGDGYVPLNYETCGTSDTKIGVTNWSNGKVLKGYIRNLKVYSIAEVLH